MARGDAVQRIPLGGARGAILVGDVRDGIRTLAPASVHCVVTSPPYWALRDYGVEGQLGREESPEAHVEAILEVFGEVARVMRPDATMWVNYGDAYFHSGMRRDGGHDLVDGGRRKLDAARGAALGGPVAPHDVLKEKDLVGMPWRVAFALQAAGWYLRADCIWAKPNPMPESIRDRPSKSHEYVFLLAHPESKGRYFYDADGARQPSRGSWNAQEFAKVTAKDAKAVAEQNLRNRGIGTAHEDRVCTGRNLRTVWSIATEPYADAHFATYPTELVRTCLRAGMSAKGVCPACGAPWRRVVKAEGGTIGASWHDHANDAEQGANQGGAERTKKMAEGYARTDLGWRPGCGCMDNAPVPAHLSPVPGTVLDPFSGAGTTGLVALEMGYRYVGCELNPAYAELARKRLVGEAQQARIF